MNPVRVLEEQALLRDRLSVPHYAKYMQPFLEDVKEKHAGPVISGSDGNPSGWHFCQREQKRLELAEAYFLSAEMMPLVRWAAAGLNGTDRFARDLWPTDFGFLYMEDGLTQTEIWGRTVVTKAMSWGRALSDSSGYGTYLVLYTDMNDLRDQVNARVKADALTASDWAKYESMGHLHVHHVLWYPDDMRVGPERVLIPEHYAKYAVGEQQLAHDADNDGRFILAFLMMLNQTVTSVEEHQTDKRATKRFKRMGLPSKVTVIRLRRHKDANRYEGESLVEWSHRWIVRGHWAWRHCGEDHPHASPYSGGWRTRVWIAPYVKNAHRTDLPFRQSDKVYALVR